jgi:hypothetical protein
MNISEQELRDMVRSAIARTEQTRPPAAGNPSGTVHASHGRFALAGGGDADGRCLIETAVACTHCGYCQSLGH